MKQTTKNYIRNTVLGSMAVGVAAAYFGALCHDYEGPRQRAFYEASQSGAIVVPLEEVTAQLFATHHGSKHIDGMKLTYRAAPGSECKEITWYLLSDSAAVRGPMPFNDCSKSYRVPQSLFDEVNKR